jgi:ubiquinone/menaquinone biosynthesis C-methylase UbiE
MNNQQDHWNNLHSNRKFDPFADNETSFAKECLSYFKPGSKILELGCGAGNDSNFFATSGFEITATDFSDQAIKQNQQKYQNENLNFEVLNIAKSFSYPVKTFDIIYARLSLHYFTDQKTREVFKEIARILKPDGLLCFMCKSPQDILYGKGEKIEEDMFENEGHVRHFFSEDYAKKLLSNNFTIKTIAADKESIYGHDSAFIKVIAQKN